MNEETYEIIKDWVMAHADLGGDVAIGELLEFLKSLQSHDIIREEERL